MLRFPFYLRITFKVKYFLIKIPSWLPMGRGNPAAALQGPSAVSYQARHALPQDPAVTVPLGVQPKELEAGSWEHLRVAVYSMHMGVYNSFTRSCQTSEATKMSFKEGEGTHITMSYPEAGMLLRTTTK